jgi:hypothetical protein
MHSLFEEQIKASKLASIYHMELYARLLRGSALVFPARMDFALGPEEYLAQVSRIKEAVDVPVIGSLNGTTRSGWVDYARRIQQAGADALELNVYYVPPTPPKVLMRSSSASSMLRRRWRQRSRSGGDQVVALLYGAAKPRIPAGDGRRQGFCSVQPLLSPGA